MFRYVIFADRRAKAELDQASKLTGSNIRTTRIVTDILGKFFFAAVWSFEARLDSDPGRNDPLLLNRLCVWKVGFAQVTFEYLQIILRRPLMI